MKNPIIVPLFSTNKQDFTYTWTAAAANTLTSEIVQIPRPADEIGMWSMFLKGTGAVNVTVALFQSLKPTVLSPVSHSIAGYTNGNAAQVTTFQPANGFETYLSAHGWWVFNPGGFKIILTRASSVEVVFSYAGVKAL